MPSLYGPALVVAANFLEASRDATRSSRRFENGICDMPFHGLSIRCRTK
jgi:hypothetical protein